MKDNVHDTHFCWKYPTNVAVLWVFEKNFKFLPMLEWLNVDLFLFHLISSNSQLTKNGQIEVNF